jgi:hypothetical protein
MLFFKTKKRAPQVLETLEGALPISHALEVHVSMSMPESTLFAFIPLTKGYYATVDAIDHEWLSQWKWHYHSAGYAARTKKFRRKKTQIYMHRLIMESPAGMRTDHRNGNGLDNRRQNLRITTASGNNCNRRVIVGKSTFKGVAWDKQTGKWRASVQINHRIIHLGRFYAEEDAAQAYDTAARIYHGEFAVLNFPEVA